MGRLISNKTFDFGADPNHDPYPGICITAGCGMANWKNVSGSVALAELSGLRVLIGP